MHFENSMIYILYDEREIRFSLIIEYNFYEKIIHGKNI